MPSSRVLVKLIIAHSYEGCYAAIKIMLMKNLLAFGVVTEKAVFTIEFPRGS